MGQNSLIKLSMNFMKTEKALPESAALDHTKVVAPYVRIAGIIGVNADNKIYKYDLRFIQPNSGLIPSPILHSLEHLLAVAMREHLAGIIDISPMGCQTGFYLVTLNQPYAEVIIALDKALHDVLKYTEVPFANELQCGSAKLHDLPGAKKYAKIMLDGRNNWEIGGRTQMNLSENIELH